MAVVCLVCDKVFSNQSGLNRHRKEVHGLESFKVAYAKSLYNYKCLEENCDTSFIGSSQLRLHLKIEHNIDDEEIQIDFPCYEDFKKWLTNEETENSVQYFKGTGTKKSKISTLKRNYFYCFRSGYQPKSLENPQRFPKTVGSCKTDKYCTSTIIVNEDTNTGKCNVNYHKRHYGHDKEIKYLKVSQLDKEVIAAKLILGIPASKILNTARETVDHTINRRNLLTSKDIQNISIAYNVNLQNGCRHADDAISVDMWVTQCLESDNNPVIYYKKQGDVCHEFKLFPQDFCLIIMDKVQLELFKNFGTKFIALDSTHGLNAYDFELTTILSVDEFHEGMPLAFMFTNRKDSFINSVFFQKLREKLGTIKTDTFMSDITNVFYNPWQTIMGPANKQLYCSWHIDRAWQSNLSKINNAEKKEWVYKTLKYLQTLLDVQKFEDGLTHFLEVLNNESTLKFRDYFINYYSTCCEKWAYCFRIGTIANTNMHLESMHKTIKYHYLQGKKIKRLDKTLHVLMEFLKNKKFDRIIKLTKGNTSQMIKNIRLRHRVAITTKFIIDILEVDKLYAITDNLNKNKYLVIKNVFNTKVCCPITCSICCICLHSYSCNCLDYNIRTVICKHIHYIAFNCANSKNMTAEAEESNKIELHNITEDLATSSTNKKKMLDEISCRSLSLIQKCKTREYSTDQLKLILENIKKAELISDIESKKFVLKTENVGEPANKKIRKQISFHSTRKKNKNKNHSRKPNSQETQIIKETLYGSHSAVTSVNPENDHCYL